jgi:hypothetical protein
VLQQSALQTVLPPIGVDPAAQHLLRLQREGFRYEKPELFVCLVAPSTFEFLVES